MFEPEFLAAGPGEWSWSSIAAQAGTRQIRAEDRVVDVLFRLGRGTPAARTHLARALTCGLDAARVERALGSGAPRAVRLSGSARPDFAMYDEATDHITLVVEAKLAGGKAQAASLAGLRRRLAARSAAFDMRAAPGWDLDQATHEGIWQIDAALLAPAHWVSSDLQLELSDVLPVFWTGDEHRDVSAAYPDSYCADRWSTVRHTATADYLAAVPPKEFAVGSERQLVDLLIRMLRSPWRGAHRSDATAQLTR